MSFKGRKFNKADKGGEKCYKRQLDLRINPYKKRGGKSMRKLRDRNFLERKFDLEIFLAGF